MPYFYIFGKQFFGYIFCYIMIGRLIEPLNDDKLRFLSWTLGQHCCCIIFKICVKQRKNIYEEKQFSVTCNFKTPRAYFYEANVNTNKVAKCKFLISVYVLFLI